MNAVDLEARTAETLAPLRREYIVESLDGLVWQVGGAIHFLERGEDAAAERAMARAFDFARSAATKMRELRSSQSNKPAERNEVAA